MQRRSFLVAGLVAWNWLPVAFRLVPMAQSDMFLANLGTLLFSRGWTESTPE